MSSSSTSRTMQQSESAPARTSEFTHKMISAAMGKTPADAIIENCNLVCVYTGQVIPDMQIAIHDDRISFVGRDAAHVRGTHTKIIDVCGMYAAPGLADPHVHIDQYVMPSEFAGPALLHGVTSLFSDPIDVTSVGGERGFDAFLNASRRLPIRIFQTVPGGLPVDPAMSRRSSGAAFSPKKITKTVKNNSDVLGVGEVFSWTRVTNQDPRTISMISEMTTLNCAINGHTAGASGRKLAAYVASGIISCHEPINFEQVQERLQMGMWVMIREGSIRRDLHEIIRQIISNGTYTDRLMFCSDGISPADIRQYGYLDYCIREAVRLGTSITDAIIMASRNVFDYYMMSRDLGGIAPGRLADIILFENPDDFRPHTVMVGGKTVVAGGKLTTYAAVPAKKRQIPAWIKKTVHVSRVAGRDFEVKSKAKCTAANTIVLKTEIITGLGSAKIVMRDDDNVIVPHPDEQDVWKVAAIDRNTEGQNPPRRTIAFLQGLGGDVGAFGSTWSFHENDMMIVGSDDAEMARVANHLSACGGGVAVSHKGRIAASMPLQFAGVVSTAPFDTVVQQSEQINAAMADAGCVFERPILIPLFLPFLALPSVRITAGGMVDVRASRRIKPLCK